MVVLLTILISLKLFFVANVICVLLFQHQWCVNIIFTLYILYLFLLTLCIIFWKNIMPDFKLKVWFACSQGIINDQKSVIFSLNNLTTLLFLCFDIIFYCWMFNVNDSAWICLFFTVCAPCGLTIHIVISISHKYTKHIWMKYFFNIGQWKCLLHFGYYSHILWAKWKCDFEHISCVYFVWNKNNISYKQLFTSVVYHYQPYSKSTLFLRFKSTRVISRCVTQSERFYSYKY